MSRMTLFRSLACHFGFAENEEPRLSWSELRRSYRREPSFTRFLPVMDWNRETRLFRLSDLSWAAILDLSPVDAEARTVDQLDRMLESMVGAFSCIPEQDTDPWIVQMYLSDEPLMEAIRRLDEYVGETDAPRDDFLTDFLGIMQTHLSDIGRPGGVFEDPHTAIPWGGRMRRSRLVLYRRRDPSARTAPGQPGPLEELDLLTEKLSRGLHTAGIRARRIGPGDYANWLTPWLNPKPNGFDDSWSWLARFGDPGEREFPQPYDLHRSVLLHCPESDAEAGVWRFNGLPHRFLPVLGFRQEPRPGLLTLERVLGRGRGAAFFDQLPEGTVFCQTMVFQPQDRIADHLAFIQGRSLSDSAESELVRENIEQCQAAMARGHPLRYATQGFFLRGADDVQLRRRMDHVIALCRDEGLDTVDSDGDVFPVDALVRNLPAAYLPKYDPVLQRERLAWEMNLHAAGPLFGKAGGSGRPGWLFFDRAGQPLMVDPLHAMDRDRAPHALVVGPTGTGKSALLNYLCLQALAMHRPHLYIVDVGDSFRIMGEWLRSRGLSVHHVRLDQAADVRMPPFASSDRMLREQIDPDRDGADAEDQVDFLAEMEAAARMIITGGDRDEERMYNRQVRTYVRAALVDSALDARAAGAAHATISDFSRVLAEYATGRIPWGYDTAVEGELRARMQTLSDNARFFVHGTRGELFDRTGVRWPEVDVTILDFGNLAQNADTRDILELGFVSFMNSVQRGAEGRRGTGRQSIVVIDEGHITTTNPVLADYLVKGSKMWRKWGLWLWLATQSLRDFPTDAKQILSMAEFWLCLSMSKEEVAEVATFRSLSEEDRNLLEDARKAPGLYTEGVLLSNRDPMLFRVVPPALALALAQTEESEVADRRRLMNELNLASEMEAVELIADRIREDRLQ